MKNMVGFRARIWNFSVAPIKKKRKKENKKKEEEKNSMSRVGFIFIFSLEEQCTKKF